MKEDEKQFIDSKEKNFLSITYLGVSEDISELKEK